MRNINLYAIIIFAALLSACESERDTTLQDSIQSSDNITVNVDYDPANSIIPFPNNILFSGSLDGTLNIPASPDDTAGETATKAALNALDGFSTVAPISVGFTGAIDETTFAGAVRLFEVTLTADAVPVVDTIVAELTFGADFVATLSSIDSTSSTLVILPLLPLKTKTSYLVVITSDMRAADGGLVGSTAPYALSKGAFPLVDGSGASTNPALSDDEAVALEPLRQIGNAAETAVTAFDSTLTTSDIIISWQFSTQSAGDVLTVARGLAGTPTTAFAASTVNLGSGAGMTPAGLGNLYTGTIDVPYYLTASTGGVNDPTALGSSWQALNAVAGENNLTRYNPLPTPTDPALTIPMLVSTPTTSAPWPVVIFQHGITSDRTAMLALADLFAVNGFALVAIDMPMHGVNNTSPFYDAGNERTFDLDLVTQDMNGSITAPVPDGTTDSSGRHFINLTNLLNTRDNVRQAVADLFAVTAAIATMDVDTGGADFDASEIYFVGHSLGAMVGTTFLALEPNVKDGVLANSGVSFAKILDGSASFGPEISAGLAANGVVKGTADYESFMASAQNVIGSGDPVNYATTATMGRGILLFEIVGGNGSPSDLVVPNTVPDGNDTTGTVPAPLAGTEPQIALMGLTHINATPTAGTNLGLATKFIAGDHRSFLDPSADADVTTEMQAEALTFIATDGATVSVADDTVLAAPAP